MSSAIALFLMAINLQISDYQQWETLYLTADYSGAVRFAENKVSADSTDADALGMLVLSGMGMFPPEVSYADLAEKAVELNSTSAIAWIALGASFLAEEEYDDSEEAFLFAVALDPEIGIADNGLGYLCELNGEPESAVVYYLTALEYFPADSFARQRIRAIADDEYMYFHAIGKADTGFDLTTSFNLSSWTGNHNTTTLDWSLYSDYVFSEKGNSVDVDVHAVYDMDRDEDAPQRDEGSISISGDIWISNVTFIEASALWDRARLTEREWQITSSLAGGWCGWITDWLYFSPEAGIGLVSTKWSEKIDENRIDQATIFLSSGVYFNKLHTLVDTWSIFGNIFIPPDDPGSYITHGEIELSFQTWEPLSISIGYDVDYTHRPVISSWSKFQTRFYTSIFLDII
ncbi:MAG: DUF481 domain-containing protein [FCB group bacterium]|nr:DUF481 domain-containing protein [FCB group bacterium]